MTKGRGALSSIFDAGDVEPENGDTNRASLTIITRLLPNSDQTTTASLIAYASEDPKDAFSLDRRDKLPGPYATPSKPRGPGTLARLVCDLLYVLVSRRSGTGKFLLHLERRRR